MLVGRVGWYEIELLYLEDLFILLEETQKTWKSNLQDIDNEIEALNQEQKEAYIEHHYDNIVQMRDVLPRITKNAILVNAYAFFEMNLNHFYNEVRNLLSSDDNSRRPKDRINFLNRISDDKFAQIEEIEQLELVRELRNRIMHSIGKVDEINFADLVKKIEKNPYITLNQLEEIVFQDEFVVKTIQVIRKVLRELNHQASKLKV